MLTRLRVAQQPTSVWTEQRAQAVYDALVAEGVSKDQLEIVANGGTDNMFGKDSLNRVVVMEKL